MITRKKPNRLKWKTKLPGVQHAILPSQTTRPNPLVVGELIFASIFSPGAICAAKRKTGELLWMKRLDALGSGSVVVRGRNLYARSSRTLFALDPNTGRVRWEFSPVPEQGEWIYSYPSVQSGRVFIGDRLGYFSCLDANTGRRLWRRLSSKGSNNQVNSTALVMRNRVICANNQGAVVCYSPKTGETIWRQKVDGPCTHELLLFRSNVIVASKSLYAINLETGTICNQWVFPLQTVSSAAVVGSRIALILGKDFQAQPSAWYKPNAFNTDLVILEGGRETSRRTLKGTATLRAGQENGLLYAAMHSSLKILDSADASLLTSRRGWIALPAVSGDQLYGLSSDGVLFSELAL
jgi:PQQ-like domain